MFDPRFVASWYALGFGYYMYLIFRDKLPQTVDRLTQGFPGDINLFTFWGTLIGVFIGITFFPALFCFRNWPLSKKEKLNTISKFCELYSDEFGEEPDYSDPVQYNSIEIIMFTKRGQFTGMGKNVITAKYDAVKKADYAFKFL